MTIASFVGVVIVICYATKDGHDYDCGGGYEYEYEYGTFETLKTTNV